MLVLDGLLLLLSSLQLRVQARHASFQVDDIRLERVDLLLRVSELLGKLCFLGHKSVVLLGEIIAEDSSTLFSDNCCRSMEDSFHASSRDDVNNSLCTMLRSSFISELAN